MNKIFITGDSFCHHRDYESWPHILAHNINLKLEGKGYAGYSWWPSFKLAQKYRLLKEYDSTDFFIFCHTEFSRPLNYSEFFDPSIGHHTSDTEIWETYFKYFYNEEFQLWCLKNYMIELARLFRYRKIIHLICFEELKMYEKINEEIYGVVIQDSLMSLTDWKAEKPVYYQTGKNHLSPDTNSSLAMKLLKICQNYDKIIGENKNVFVPLEYNDS